MLNRAFAIVVLTVALGATAHAQPSPASRWNAQLTKSTELLKSGDHAQALQVVENVIAEMLDQLGAGDPAKRAFGIAVSHKAIALAGLGRNEDALWYWQTALAVYPPLARSDVATFGEAGAFLAANRELRKPLASAAKTASDAPDVTVPKLLHRVNAEYPAGARHFGARGSITVNVLITREGRVRSPVIVEALPAPTLAYATLEALRQWKFEPGKRGGEPVDVELELVVDFRLSGPSR